MSRAKVRAQTTCNDCDRPFYAKGLCKSCYMKVNRETFRKPKAGRLDLSRFVVEDPEDFWQFVKAELKIG